MRKASKLSVAEKVEAALHLHRTLYPGQPISVSALSRSAGVNRSNLYAHHAETIRSLRRKKRNSNSERSTDESLAKKRGLQLVAEKKKYLSLVYLVSELRLENQRLRDRLAEATAKKKR